MSDDRTRVRELLKRAVLHDFNDWAALSEIVERNQNNGIFTEEEWTALRDWLRAENDRDVAIDKARTVLMGKL